MGKTKKVKLRAKNSIGISSVYDSDFDEFGSEFMNSSGPINSIVEQLQSASIEEKLCGLQTLSTLCQNNSNVQLIIGSDIVRIAAPFLVDANLSIRHATAGSLRNLSLCSIDICETLVEQDILTPLLALLTQYAIADDWIPSFDKTMNNQIDERSDTFLQAVNIVWNLCESSSTALEFFNQSHLLKSFIRELNWNVYGIEIAMTVAQCLLVISEDNPSCWGILSENGNDFINLLNIGEDDNFSSTILRTLSAGIMSNVPALSLPYSNHIFQALSKVLNINHKTYLGKLTSILPLDGVDREGYEIEVTDDSAISMEEETETAAVLRRRKADLPSEVDLEVKNIEYLLEAQRIAAETLTNICSSEDEETMNEDEDEMSDAESVHDYDKSTHSSSSNLQNVDKLSVDIQEAIKALGLVEKLWQRAQPLPENVIEILKEAKPVLLHKLKKLRIASVLCLHNLCNVLSTEDLGGPAAIYSVWLDLGQQAFKKPEDPELLEPTTSLMRATLEHLRNNPELFAQMTNTDLDLILSGINNCKQTEICANWLRMLGILGCFLPEELVKTIMSFIIEICSKSTTDAWTMSEALDSLMDMFSDKDWIQICMEFNLSKKVREFDRILKNKLRQQKRELGERFHAVSTVRTNLGRFAKYIDEQQKIAAK